MKLVTSAQMRTLEERAGGAGVGVDQLMESAGLNVAQEVWMQLGQVEDRRIVVLVGPGNNGGDGLVAARHLAEWGAAVRCYALGERDDDQWRRTVDAGIPCGSVDEDNEFEALDALLDRAEVIVDALLGTGRTRPIDGDLGEILRRVGRARERIVKPKLIAVDLPTGLDADTGRVDPLTVAPDETVTFQYPKVGLYTQPGAAFAGDVQVVDIGVPAGLDDDMRIELIERRDAKRLLPPRPADAHKGTFGKVLVVAGSANYPGAAILAASAAYRAGAGLVALATARSLIPALVAAMPEVIYHPLPEESPGVLGDAAAQDLHDLVSTYDAVVVGCGLGRDPATTSLVRTVVRDPNLAQLRGLVIDADGLNALAGTAPWPEITAPFVVTPHPGEMARLRADAAGDDSDRLAQAVDSAASWGGHVVLKGANTIVAAPDGRASVSAIAHAALATAGTGDVLAGALGGLLAQGLPPYEAATLAVYLHGHAGERAAREVGTAGTTARDVLQQLALAGRALAGEEPVGAASGGLGMGGGLGGLPGLGGRADMGQLLGGGALGSDLGDLGFAGGVGGAAPFAGPSLGDPSGGAGSER